MWAHYDILPYVPAVSPVLMIYIQNLGSLARVSPEMNFVGIPIEINFDFWRNYWPKFQSIFHRKKSNISISTANRNLDFDFDCWNRNSDKQSK
jgi:hypothetical protein